ncbi:ABC transporter permease [Rhizobium leguminosarum]
MTDPTLRRLLLPAGLLVGALAFLPNSQSLFHALFPALERPVYRRVSLVELTASHVVVVLVATALAALIGIGLAVAVSRPASRRVKPLVMAVAAIGQSFPPVAVLAVTVPLLGYGSAPTVVALFAYALLPIIVNTVAGLEGVDAGVMEASDGMGLSPRQRLLKVELPLAGPIIIAGIRTAAIINVGTATVGSTVGAATLGNPIIEGLSAYNTAYVLQGALLVGLLAIVVDRAIAAAGMAVVANVVRHRPA